VGLLFLIAFAAGGAIANSPEVLKAAAAHSPEPEPVFKMTHLEGTPLMVRIVYLDQPTLEIPVPPLPMHGSEQASAPQTVAPETDPAQPQVVVISNTEDGVQGVLIEP
jgi:hypothetical protein